MDDSEVWGCNALLKPDHGEEPLWRLERGSAFTRDEEERIRNARPPEFDRDREEYPQDHLYPVAAEDGRWRWVYNGQSEGEGDDRVPQKIALPEEPMVGYWERYLLAMTVGEPDVWRFAEQASVPATAL
jgi:hypothetical protein